MITPAVTRDSASADPGARVPLASTFFQLAMSLVGAKSAPQQIGYVMPVYQIVTRRGVLTDGHRREVAAAVTDAHVLVTGAPEFFVNVVFQDLDDNRLFTGGKPSQVSIISGVIRAGRSPEEKKRLLQELSSAWCRITGSSPRDVLIGLSDIDPSSAMEAGLLFPAPGEEEEWLAANKDALTSLADDHHSPAG